MENQNRNGCLNKTFSICMDRNPTPLQEYLPSQCKQSIFAVIKVNKLTNRKTAAEREKVQLLSELCIANDEAKDMALKLEKPNAKAMAYQLMLSRMSNPREDEQLMIVPKSYHQHIGILRELDDVKQQICKLKLGMASALQQKAKAQMETEFSSAEFCSYSRHSEEVRREIEEANTEQVLIDLARIEAEREFKHIEAERQTEAANFTKSMEKVKSRINDLRTEISSAKKLQTELVITASDVNALQNEMQFIREMNQSFRKTYLVDNIDKREEEEISISSLQSTKTELEVAKKEVSSRKEEGFMIMDEMDVIRKELMQIADGKEQSRRAKKNSDSSLECLNTKLHKAMSKMESASMAEKRADAIVATLCAALQQLQSDIDAAKRETELITQETKAVRTATEKTKLCTQSAKERFQEAMKELKRLKASEANALEELKAITESTMSDRAISSLWSSTISISKFEYYYLIKQAKASQEVADKKVAAAQAWMEVLKAESKERSMKEEADGRENWSPVPVEGKGVSKPKKAFVFKKAIKTELNQPEQQQEKYVQSHDIKLAIAMPRRSLTVYGISGASRRLSTRRPSNSLRWRTSFTSTPPPIASKKKGKVMDKIVNFLRGRSYRKQLCSFGGQGAMHK